MKVLVIEDEQKIANSIKKGLMQEKFAVDVAYNGNAGFDLGLNDTYDAIILDLLLPGISGLEVCKKLREEKIATPILMLTAKGQIEDKVSGLNIGADDYVVKPFAFEELVARIRALTRRPKENVEDVIKVNNLLLNATNYEVKKDGKKINLSSKEFSLLRYLMRNAGKIVTKDQIISHVWSDEDDVLPNTVEVYVGYLRNKIGSGIIHTARGFGYKLEK